MGVHLRRTAGASSGSLDQPVEEWPFLDQAVLERSRSRKVCMTCHWFRLHSGVNCIPLLTCQLHQGLLAHGEHLVHRCQGWTDDMARQQAPPALPPGRAGAQGLPPGGSVIDVA